MNWPHSSACGAALRYNDSVQVYNVAVRQFPGNLIAWILGFKEQPFFEAPPAARQTPQVKF